MQKEDKTDAKFTIIEIHGGNWIKVREATALVQSSCRSWPEYLRNPLNRPKFYAE